MGAAVAPPVAAAPWTLTVRVAPTTSLVVVVVVAEAAVPGVELSAPDLKRAAGALGGIMHQGDIGIGVAGAGESPAEALPCAGRHDSLRQAVVPIVIIQIDMAVAADQLDPDTESVLAGDRRDVIKPLVHA